MANKILFKRSELGAPDDLDYGEIALNYAEGKIYYKNSVSEQVTELSGESDLLIQEGFVLNHRSGGTAVNGEEDASYYDIVLTQSPYVSVDPDTAVVVFEGGFFSTNNGQLLSADNITTNIINSGTKLRISSSVNSSSGYFIGYWRIIGG